jgi:hypothetical protein
MIIDLNFLELIPTVSTLEALNVKAKDAYNLLQQLKQNEIAASMANAAK